MPTSFRHDAVGALSRVLRGLCTGQARVTGIQRLGPDRWSATMELLRGANDGATTVLEFTRAVASLRLASQASLPAPCLTGVHRDRAGRDYRLAEEEGRLQWFDPLRREWRAVALPNGEGPSTLSLQPDGHVYAGRRVDGAVAVFRLEGAACRMVGRTPAGVSSRGHAVLPDGRAFALVRADNDDQLLALEEGAPRRVVADPPQRGPLAGMWTHVTVAPDGLALWLVPPSGGAVERPVYRVDPAQVQPDGTLRAEPLEMALPQFTSGFVHTMESNGQAALHVQFLEPHGGQRIWSAAWDGNDRGWRIPRLMAGQGAWPPVVFVAGERRQAGVLGRRETPMASVLLQALDALLRKPLPTAPLLPLGPVPKWRA